MKKLVILLLVICMVTGVIAAQEKEAASGEVKNAITVDIAPLFMGFALSEGDLKISTFGIAAEYERIVVANYSFGGRLHYLSSTAKEAKIKTSVFAISLLGRWYPLSTSLEKLFLGTGIGVDVLTIDFDGDSDNWFGLALDLHIGWKQAMGKNFFMVPSAGYRISKAGGIWRPFEEMLDSCGLSGWYGSLGLGMRF